MSKLTESDKSTFHRIIGDTVRHYADIRAAGQPIPDWIQKQVDGIYTMETDPVSGMAVFVEGLQDETEHLQELLHG
jgi:hypothetical protein